MRNILALSLESDEEKKAVASEVSSATQRAVNQATNNLEEALRATLETTGLDQLAVTRIHLAVSSLWRATLIHQYMARGRIPNSNQRLDAHSQILISNIKQTKSIV